MMPTDLEQLLTGSLNERAAAGSPIDAAPLLRTVVDRGRRRRTGRRVAGAVLVVAAVAGTTGTVAALGPATDRGNSPAGGATSSAFPSANLALLAAPAEVPGALADPALIGTDPGVVHLNVDAWAAGSWRSTWHSTGTYESANIQRGDFQAYAAVSRDRAALPPSESFSAMYERMASVLPRSAPSDVVIGGRPGTVTNRSIVRLREPGPTTAADPRLWSLVWQPADGFWATVEVQTGSLDEALRAAGQVRFDRATRCAVPFRVGELPSGTTLRSCRVSLVADQGGVFGDAQLDYGNGTDRMQLIGAFAPPGSAEGGYTLQAGPNRAYPDPDGSYTMLIKPIHFTLTPRGYSRAEETAVLASVRTIPTVHDPATYP
jgi:hypothetical protein